MTQRNEGRPADAAEMRRFGLLDDDAYRKARLLVMLVYATTSAALELPPAAREGQVTQSRHADPTATARAMRRAAVATGSKAIRAHEGEPVRLDSELSELDRALERGQREGWLGAAEAARLRSLSASLEPPAQTG